MAPQSVRRLDIELPDAGVVVVDPDFRTREFRIGTLRNERDDVSRATSDSRRP